MKPEEGRMRWEEKESNQLSQVGQVGALHLKSSQARLNKKKERERADSQPFNQSEQEGKY